MKIPLGQKDGLINYHHLQSDSKGLEIAKFYILKSITNTLGHLNFLLFLKPIYR